MPTECKHWNNYSWEEHEKHKVTSLSNSNPVNSTFKPTSYYKKMYEKTDTVYLVTSASAIHNNLVKSADDDNKVLAIAVIHEGYVNLIMQGFNLTERDQYIPCVFPDTRPKRVTSVVTQVMWCRLGEHRHFVMTSSLGVHIYDEEARMIRFFNRCTEVKEDPGGHYSRGIATLGQNNLFVGTSSGYIWVFQVRGNATEDISLLQSKQAHPSSITVLAGSKSSNTLASADENGSVVLWTFGNQLQRIAAVESYSAPCITMHIWNDAVICGYSSGHIRCFDVHNGKILIEVGAHARSLTAMDVLDDKGYILTVSEDALAKVWQISGKNHKFKLLETVSVDNRLLVGGQFLDRDGTKFCISSYDDNEIFCYTLKK